jgi:hypothetical protein
VGLNRSEIISLVRNSFEASFLDQESITRHLSAVESAARMQDR